MLKQCKVLYVEDEPMALDELGQFLKRRVGTLITAHNGAEGLEAHRLYQPEIVITDLRMPEMTGLEMMARIREQDRDCRFIVISAISDAQTILEAVEAGIARYVVKPVVPEELVLVLEQAASDRLANHRVSSFDVILENRPEIEQRLRSELAAFIKRKTGKGPISVRALMKNRCFELIAEGILTVYEQSLVVNNRNGALVAYMRSLFYQEHRSEVEKIFSEVLSVPVVLSETQCRPDRNIESVCFRFGE